MQNIVASSCALFAMLFGAGNIILPLILGRSLGTATPIALLGFIITGVFIPLVGFVALMYAKGDHREFLGGLGKIPSLIIACLCMGLLGPFGAAPRCIAIAHADLSWYVPGINMAIFSAGAALVIWLCCYQQNKVIALLGRYLGPAKILCLFAILLLGLLSEAPGEMMHNASSTEIFWQGFSSGYGTMDLLAIIFFSQLVYAGLASKHMTGQYLGVSLLAGFMLAAVYIGFAAMAAIHSERVIGIGDDTMLSALASLLLGTKAGIFANITIGLTCLTTAIALTATFAEFLSRDVFGGRISYKTALTLSVILSALMANLRFTGIMHFVLPWLSLCYPGLMIFAILRIGIHFGWAKGSHARAGFFVALAFSCLNAVLS